MVVLVAVLESKTNCWPPLLIVSLAAVPGRQGRAVAGGTPNSIFPLVLTIARPVPVTFPAAMIVEPNELSLPTLRSGLSMNSSPL
jgi:hypothetical protein